MNDIKVGDTVRDKKTGVVGKVISDSSYANMYRIDAGEYCVWVDYADAEKVEVVVDEKK